MQIGGKWTLQGVFDSFFYAPGTAPPIKVALFFIYLVLSGVVVTNEEKIQVEIRAASEPLSPDDRPLFRATLTLKAQPNAAPALTENASLPVPVALPVAGVQFQKPGSYNVVVIYGGEVIGVVPFDVRENPR
ncbi:hypothetical protein EDM80_01610 [bacterium]|nr:MAG: hypothetical protein EDM80_01610 [bacterium]RIK63182.1 MAG: hypothetical protein DCC64_07765 [Planctomycetota bacterium]